MRKSTKSFEADGIVALGGCGGIIGIYLIFILIGGFCLNYTVDTWLAFVGKGDFPILAAFAFCIIPTVGQISFFAAIVTFIASFFF